MVSATAWVLGIFVATIYLASLYNKYVTLKHSVTKAWSNVDVLLKQRNEELKRLIAACKPYMKYEQALFEEIARARTLEISVRASASPKQAGSAETSLRRSTAKLLALVERYPELKAGESFVHISTRIAALEQGIADRRTFYNDVVQLNNVSVERFPGNLFATCFGFTQADGFHFVQPSELKASRDGY
jgi:LemA protein